MTLGKKEGRRQTETKQPFVCLEVVVYLDRQSMGPAFPKLAIGLGPSCITTRCESQWQLTTPEVGGTSDCPSIWFAMGSGVANFCGECQITHVRLKREHKKHTICLRRLRWHRPAVSELKSKLLSVPSASSDIRIKSRSVYIVVCTEKYLAKQRKNAAARAGEVPAYDKAIPIVYSSEIYHPDRDKFPYCLVCLQSRARASFWVPILLEAAWLVCATHVLYMSSF